LALQAFAQRRFADPLAAPLAIITAWWIVGMWPRLRLPHGNIWLRFATACAFAVVLQLPTMTYAFQRAGETRIDDQKSAERVLFEWLGSREDLPLGDAARPGGTDPNLNPVAPGGENPLDTRGAVMAAWDFGHLIEWAAQRPTIATNFGTYIGVDSFRDPALFFMSEDAGTAEQILAARDVRYVVTTSRFPSLVPTLVKALGDDRSMADYQRRFSEGGRKGMQLLPRFYRTTGAMLFDVGNDMDGPEGPAQAIDYMRLVYLSPLVVQVSPQLGGQQSAGRIWERVPGAQLVSNVGVGKPLRVEVHFETRNRHGEILFTGKWMNRAVGDDTGFARLRVPYHDGLNGAVWVTSILWGDDEQLQVLNLSEQAVLAGDSVVQLQ